MGSAPQDKTPLTVRTIKDLRAIVADWRQAGETIGMVPTMGALHKGHLSLVDTIRTETTRSIASIFVNPTQFAPHEDFESYPRTEEDDLSKLAAHGVDLVFIPSAREMYPGGFDTALTIGGPALELETEYRPHFFSGVAIVVAKLLLTCCPDAAIFGEKDYQQLLVIRQMARDLNLPTQILSGTTVREPDGLALSSRNAYLTREERLSATTLIKTLRETATAIEGQQAAPASLLATAKQTLTEAGFTVDYVELRNADNLSEVDETSADQANPLRLLAAAWLGKTRLIDNIPVDVPLSG